MYLSHYHLTYKPFQISSDPKFLWLGEKHKEAFAVLKYGILDNKGFLLLTGDVGTGKTTLINALVNSMESDVIVATVPDPDLSILDFFNYIASAFGADKWFQSKGEFLQFFQGFLNTAYRNGKKVLLIIDEAQRLKYELLEEIRVLSNIEKQSTKLLNIFFVGQDEFNGLLWEDRNRALRQRITLNYQVSALNQEEIHSYITHRLKVAGTEEMIFTSDAIQEIMRYSGGFPRMVNIICDHALLTGFVKEKRKIDQKIIRECAGDLRIPKYIPRIDKIAEEIPNSKMQSEVFFERNAVDSPSAHVYQNISANRSILKASIIFLFILFIIVGYFIYHSSTLPDQIQQQWNQLTNPHKQSPSMDTGIEQPGESVIEIPIHRPKKSEKESLLLDDEVFSNSRSSETGQAVKMNSVSQDGYSTTENHARKSTLGNEDKVPEMEESSASTEGQNRSELEERQFSPAAEIKGNQTIDKLIIPFPHNSNSFSQQDRKELEKVTQILLQNPALSVKIIGYTDSSGPDDYNRSLSLLRAQMVTDFLMKNGVDSRQITTYGLGAASPLGTNDFPEGRRLNRRVELVFTEKRK
ncbi:MAG: type II secretory pathway protein [Desulfobacterium sp.]|nr:type II secretory pathway protein [Desulfobacterium sp.]